MWGTDNPRTLMITYFLWPFPLATSSKISSKRAGSIDIDKALLWQGRIAGLFV